MSSYAKGSGNESNIASGIVKKLSFKHLRVGLPDKLSITHLEAIDKNFLESPFPCSDGASLLYPVLSTELHEEMNLIDGMGNDVYIGHIPPKNEFERQTRWRYFDMLDGVLKYSSSESIFAVARRTRAECCGLSGLNDIEIKKILKGSFDCRKHWRDVSIAGCNTDYLEFRAKIRGGIIDTERFMRKGRNAGDVNNWNVIFPWADPEVALYFSSLPETLLFDRNNLKNKTLLRRLLKENIGLDNDKVGKMPFGFDSESLLDKVGEKVVYEIISCSFWDESVKPILDRLCTQNFRRLLLLLVPATVWPRLLHTSL